MRLSENNLESLKKCITECTEIFKMCLDNDKKKAFLVEGESLG